MFMDELNSDWRRLHPDYTRPEMEFFEPRGLRAGKPCPSTTPQLDRHVGWLALMAGMP